MAANAPLERSRSVDDSHETRPFLADDFISKEVDVEYIGVPDVGDKRLKANAGGDIQPQLSSNPLLSLHNALLKSMSWFWNKVPYNARNHIQYSKLDESEKANFEPWTVFLHCLAMFALKCFIFFLPSYISARLFKNTTNTAPPAKVHATAYLDGLRGMAALIVYFFHLSYTYFDVKTGWGVDDCWSPLRLPIIRLFYRGAAAVSIFFVVSGFALSVKPLKQMHAQQFEGLLTTISSAIFRRPIRLFLPCFISTFMVFTCGRLGLYDSTRTFYDDHNTHTGARDGGHLVPIDALGSDFFRWANETVHMMEPYDWRMDPAHKTNKTYDTHLWTIPIEFRGSIALFTSQLAVARLPAWSRIAVMFGLIVWSGSVNKWEMILFWGGALLAELDLLSQNHPTKHQSPSLPNDCTLAPKQQRTPYIKTWLTKFFWISMLLFSMYLLTCPMTNADITPGYRYLQSLKPENITFGYRFWEIIGALLLVFTVSNAPFLSCIFTTPFFAYLGKISFALYLVHGMVNHLVGFAAIWHMYRFTGHETALQIGSGFFLGALVNTVVVFWAADVFWRAFDTPCVRFGKWLEEVMVRKRKERDYVA